MAQNINEVRMTDIVAGHSANTGNLRNLTDFYVYRTRKTPVSFRQGITGNFTSLASNSIYDYDRHRRGKNTVCFL